MGGGTREEDDSRPSKARRVDITPDPPCETKHAHRAEGPARTPPPPTTTTTAGVERSRDSAPGVPSMGATRAAPRYLLRVQYDGTNFHGFQRQANARTVQGCVEDALHAFAGGGGGGGGGGGEGAETMSSSIVTHGSSRTDAGVHALDNTMHVDLPPRVSRREPTKALPPHEPHVVASALNHFLKKRGAPDVAVTRCIRVDPNRFHARHSATGRTYHYRMHVSPTPPSLFERGRVWHVCSGAGDRPLGGGAEGFYENAGDGRWGLDVEAMRLAAAHLVGTHDFSTFRASGCQASSPVRTLWDVRVDAAPSWPSFPECPATDSIRPDDFSKVEVTENPEAQSGGKDRARAPRGRPDPGAETTTRSRPPPSRSLTSGGVVVTAVGPSFLYHQVRLMVATLRAVGAGEIEPASVPALLAARTPSAVPAMAPAHGLYLSRVHYDGTREWSPLGAVPVEEGAD